MLLTLQLLHTIFAASLYAAIIATLFLHATGRSGRLLHACYALILIEVGALALNEFRCPVSTYIAAQWDSSTPTSLFPGPIRGVLLEGGVVLFGVSVLVRMGRLFVRAGRA